MLIILFITGCADKPLKVNTEDNYPLIEAKEVLLVGFKSIADRYIELTSPAKFAIEGLQGLGSIDPAMTFKTVKDELILKVNDDIVGRLHIPKKNAITAWAELTVKMVALSRQKSKEIREAKPEKIYEAVFDSILSRLDIHSRYASASEAKRNREKRDGIGGIGLRFRIIRNLPQIVAVMPETPAFKAGLKLGDRLTFVGNESLNGLKQNQIRDRLHGPIDSLLSLTVERKGKNKQTQFKIKRELIVTQSVSYEQIEGIAFIKISNFNQYTASHTQKKLKRAQADLGKRLKGIVLDLRGNTGGVLEQSIKVADLFLMKGRISITRGRHPDSNQFYEATGHDITYGVPVIVLIDGRSASAAEVTAAALQDRGRAIVIGTSSFGKGTVQTVIRMPNEGEMTLTWSQLMTPAGYRLQGLGVLPIICTSGISNHTTDGYSVIKKALANKTRVENVHKSWRKESYLNEKKKQQLRTFCPPEHRKLNLESSIATTILQDKTLYYYALNFSMADSIVP